MRRGERDKGVGRDPEGRRGGKRGRGGERERRRGRKGGATEEGGGEKEKGGGEKEGEKGGEVKNKIEGGKDFTIYITSEKRSFLSRRLVPLPSRLQIELYFA